MEGWQADLLKVGISAVIAGVAGVWGHWRWTREQRIKHSDLERQRQAEYETFKKRRRLVGAGEVERMERAARLTEILVAHREHKITPEEFQTFKDQVIGGRKNTKAQTPVAMKPQDSGLIVRTPKEIEEAYAKITDASFYWTLRQALENYQTGSFHLEPAQYESLRATAKQIEQRQKRLVLGDGSEYDRAYIDGEFSAFQWLVDRQWTNTRRTHLSEKWVEYGPGEDPPGVVRQSLLDDRPDDPKTPL